MNKISRTLRFVKNIIIKIIGPSRSPGVCYAHPYRIFVRRFYNDLFFKRNHWHSLHEFLTQSIYKDPNKPISVYRNPKDICIPVKPKEGDGSKGEERDQGYPLDGVCFQGGLVKLLKRDLKCFLNKHFVLKTGLFQSLYTIQNGLKNQVTNYVKSWKIYNQIQVVLWQYKKQDQEREKKDYHFGRRSQDKGIVSANAFRSITFSFGEDFFHTKAFNSLKPYIFIYKTIAHFLEKRSLFFKMFLFCSVYYKVWR